MTQRRPKRGSESRVAEWLGARDTSWPRVAVLVALSTLAVYLLVGWDSLLPLALAPALIGASIGLCAGTPLEALVASLASSLAGLAAYAVSFSSSGYFGAVREMPEWANRDMPMALYQYLGRILMKGPVAVAEQSGSSPWPGYLLVLVLVCFSAVGVRLLLGRKHETSRARTALAWTIVAATALSWVFTVWGPTQAIVPLMRSEPQAMAYGDDRALNAKTYFLMARGWSFYPAYVEAHAEDKRQLYPVQGGKLVHGSSALFREPTMFYLWRIIAYSGDFAAVPWFAVALGASILLGAYWSLSAAIGHRALFVGPVLFPGLIVATQAANVLLPEFWALCALLAAFFLLVRGHRWSSGVLGLVALLIRETFAVWLLALVLAEMLFALGDRTRLRAAAVFAALLVAGAAAYLAHAAAGAAYVAGSSSGYLLSYLSASAGRSLEIKLLAPLAYGMFPYGMFRISPLLPAALGLVGLWVGLRRTPDARVTATLHCALFVAYFAILGAPAQYWGEAVMLVLVIGCVLLLASLDRLTTRSTWTLTIKPSQAASPRGLSAAERKGGNVATA